MTRHTTLSFNIKLINFSIAQFSAVSVILLLGLSSYVFYIADRETVLGGFLRLFDVAAEQSIPTFFSVLNLVLSSILLLALYRYEKLNHRKFANYWLFLAILFLYLSADESASIHENFGLVHDYFVQRNIMPSILETNKWLPFGVLFVAVIALFLVPFLNSLRTTTRNLFLISGVIFLCGAIGFEFIGALMLQTGVVESRLDTIYLFRQILEEGMEMYGIALFNCALYREICLEEISVAISN